MRVDGRNRLMVPLCFTEAVQFSAMFVNFGGLGHAFVHRLKSPISAHSPAAVSVLSSMLKSLTTV
jgi:hypothetical protein